MRRRWIPVLGLLLIGRLWLGPPTDSDPRAAAPTPKVDPAFYKALQWRSIGPHRGGRVVAVAGHPTDPRTFYFGATGGGVWKTTNGGLTWENISDGFFKTGSVGAIAVSEADPNVIYVGMGESCWRGNISPGDGVYKSTDGGKTWKPMGLAETQFIARIRIHPKDPDLVYVAAMGHAFGPNPERGVYRSKDGGRTWEKILYKSDKAGAIDLVMDPNNPRVLYAALYEARRYPWGFVSGGPDSGIYKTTDGGDTWTDITNNPGLPKGLKGRIGLAVSPARPDRFQWTFPILISPHDPNVLYVGGHHVFRSTDEGRSWEVLSPDLTRNDRSKMEPSGGPITKDNTSVEYYGTVFALAESYVQKGVLWAGSDDGLVHVSRDGGRTWENVTPKDLPEWSRISIIEPSHFDAGTAYLAANRYQLDDFRPYLYKTTDFGKTWKRITNGIPPNAYTRVIREDPARRGLLYAGTEFGVFVSFDDGETWQSLQLNLPVVPVHDMVVKDDDLVVATHGRSFWVLDDLTVLRQITPDVLRATVHLFRPALTVRFRGGFARNIPNAGQNPPNGVVVYYYLKEKPKGEVRLEFLDAQGRVIRTFSSQTPEEPEEDERGPKLPAEVGLNRFVWNLRYPGPPRVRGVALWGGWPEGPMVPPGTYRVRLTVDGQTYEQSFEVVKDPRLSTPPEAFTRQFELLMKIWDKVAEVHRAVNTIREVRQQIEGVLRRTAGQAYAEDLRKAARPILDKLTAIEEELIQTRSKAPQDALNYPIKLNNKLTLLLRVVESADAEPTKQAYEVFDELSRQADAELARLREVLEKDVAAFNQAVRDLNVPAVVVPRR